jgi:hypothetical protein
MSSISGIGSAINNFLTTGGTSGTSSTASTTAASATDTFQSALLGDMIGASTSFGILGLPTAGAPGDADVLLAQIELKLAQTTTETNNNAAMNTDSGVNSARAAVLNDLTGLAQQVQNIIIANTSITADNIQITSDSQQISTLTPLESTAFTAMTAAQTAYTAASVSVSHASQTLAVDTQTIGQLQQNASANYSNYTQLASAAAIELALRNTYPTTAAAYSSANSLYKVYTTQESQYYSLYTSDTLALTSFQQQSNAQTSIINSFNLPNLYASETNAQSVYTSYSSEISSLTSQITADNQDIGTQQSNISHAEAMISELNADLSVKLTSLQVANVGLPEQQGDKIAKTNQSNRQYDHITENFKNSFISNNPGQNPIFDPNQSPSLQQIDKLVLFAASLASNLVDLANTLSNLPPAPDLNTTGQSFNTGGSRFKIGL